MRSYAHDYAKNMFFFFSSHICICLTLEYYSLLAVSKLGIEENILNFNEKHLQKTYN